MNVTGHRHVSMTRVLYECDMPRLFKWVMSYVNEISMRYSQWNESYPIWKRYGTDMNESCHTHSLPLTTPRNTLQHTATHYHLLQHTARHSLLRTTRRSWPMNATCPRYECVMSHTQFAADKTTQHIATQHTTSYCNTLQHTVCCGQHNAFDLWIIAPCHGKGETHGSWLISVWHDSFSVCHDFFTCDTTLWQESSLCVMKRVTHTHTHTYREKEREEGRERKGEGEREREGEREKRERERERERQREKEGKRVRQKEREIEREMCWTWLIFTRHDPSGVCIHPSL